MKIEGFALISMFLMWGRTCNRVARATAGRKCNEWMIYFLVVPDYKLETKPSYVFYKIPRGYRQCVEQIAADVFEMKFKDEDSQNVHDFIYFIYTYTYTLILTVSLWVASAKCFGRKCTDLYTMMYTCVHEWHYVADFYVVFLWYKFDGNFIDAYTLTLRYVWLWTE